MWIVDDIERKEGIPRMRRCESTCTGAALIRNVGSTFTTFECAHASIHIFTDPLAQAFKKHACFFLVAACFRIHRQRKEGRTDDFFFLLNQVGVTRAGRL